MSEFLPLPLPQPPSELQLSGQKVWLRAPLLDDWRAWSALRGASRDFLIPWEPTWPDDAITKAAFIRRLDRQYESWRLDMGYDFLIFRASDQALLGGCVLFNVRRGMTQTAALGYWMGQPFARQGYMHDALSALCRYAFLTLNLHRLEAGVIPSNLPSRGLLQGLGFREEGYAKSYLKINGAWQDHVLYGVLQDEWNNRPVGQRA